MPTVYTEILASCKNTHHAKRYIKFIRACLDQNVTTTYHEAHHILPKSIYPQYKSFRKCPWNKALLTGRQHYIAHWMLARAFGGKMWIAFNAMCNIRTYSNKGSSKTRTFKVSSATYAELKKTTPSIKGYQTKAKETHSSERNIRKSRYRRFAITVTTKVKTIQCLVELVKVVHYLVRSPMNTWRRSKHH